MRLPSAEMLTLDGSVCPIADSQQMANGRILLTSCVADLLFCQLGPMNYVRHYTQSLMKSDLCFEDGSPRPVVAWRSWKGMAPRVYVLASASIRWYCIFDVP